MNVLDASMEILMMYATLELNTAYVIRRHAHASP
jgi:hypothetical protein